MAIVVKAEELEGLGIDESMDAIQESTEYALFCVTEWLAVNKYLESVGIPLTKDDSGNEEDIIPMVDRVKYLINMLNGQ